MHYQLISIYDSSGQKVMNQRINYNQKQTINTSNLSSGIYFISLSESNTKPIKFVVAHWLKDYTYHSFQFYTVL